MEKNNTKDQSFTWLGKHSDTIVVLGAILSAVIWMNAQFNGVDSRFNQIEKDLVMIKTVLTMKNIMQIT